MEYYKIPIYIIFGVLPSLIWLSYYLRKDLHPEPKRMILKIFLWGALITIPVFFVQIGLTYLLAEIGLSVFWKSVVYWFVIISLTEEYFKYLVIKLKVINSQHLDEPLDIMLYMVVAALGFAALENVLYLVSPVAGLSFADIINRSMMISFIRFVGATFLHTLASAVVGYALAIASCQKEKGFLYIVLGVSTATILHGLYDFSIMTLNGYAKLLFPAFIILTLAVLSFIGFEKLKKMKGICKIN